MITLYLVRHGQTQWNCKSRTQGCKNIELTEKGIRQGELLAERLKKLKNDYVKIYTSDLSRAYITAEIINKRVNTGIEVVKELREMNFGDWEGLTISDIKRKYLNKYNLWRNAPYDVLIPNGETLLNVQKRCLKAINEIINRNNYGSIIVVSHSIAIKTIILGLLGIDLIHFYRFSLSNACINQIEFRNYGPVLVTLNDTSHLIDLENI